MFTNRCYKRILLLVAFLVGPTAAYCQQPTYAELLGWPAGTRAVIFHVDDAGMSHDSNVGAIKAVEDGVATSLSIMMPCSWVPEMTAYVKEHPQVDAGVHLTLTSEWKRYRWGPVAGKAAVPGLVDPDGCLWHGVMEVGANATVDEVETEIRAQIDKLRTAGIEPTHLDSHMGTCFLPQYLNAYVKVGIEKKIPILIFGGHMQHIGDEAGALKPLVRMIAQSVWDSGLPVIDDLVTDPTRAEDYEQRKAELMKLLGEMQPGITEVIVHCTLPSETFSYISGSGAKRHAELRLMTDPDIEAFIKKEGIVLTSWRELMQRRQRISDEKEARAAGESAATEAQGQ
jgi:predicted glycoside hydrolase/deacetylase ChbG (UPF0249 family)